MKHWSTARKWAFCISMVLYAAGFVCAAIEKDWRKALFLVLMMLFLPSLLSIYLMFDSGAYYETSDNSDAYGVPPDAAEHGGSASKTRQ